MPRPVGVLVEGGGVVVHHRLEVLRVGEVYLVELREVVSPCVAVEDVRAKGLEERFDFLDRLDRRSVDRDSFRLFKVEDKRAV